MVLAWFLLIHDGTICIHTGGSSDLLASLAALFPISEDRRLLKTALYPRSDGLV